MDGAPQGIAPVRHGIGSAHHLHAVQRILIHGDQVLGVPASRDGVVHAHTIDHQQHAVGLEATDGGTSTTELAFLNEDGARVLQQFGRGRLGHETDLPSRKHVDLLGNIRPGLVEAASTGDHFAQLVQAVAQVHHRRIGQCRPVEGDGLVGQVIHQEPPAALQAADVRAPVGHGRDGPARANAGDRNIGHRCARGLVQEGDGLGTELCTEQYRSRSDDP